MNREEKKRMTRAAIINAAIGLFNEQGFDSTTVAQITERAGVAKGTFFNYFNSKEDVLGDVKVFFTIEEVKKLAGKPGPIAPRLKALAAELVTKLQLTRTLARVLFQCTFSTTNLLDNQACHNVELVEVLTPVFAQGQERGEFTRQMPPEMLAQMAIQTYFGILVCWAMGQGDDHLTDQAAISFEIFFRGIAPA